MVVHLGKTRHNELLTLKKTYQVDTGLTKLGFEKPDTGDQFSHICLYKQSGKMVNEAYPKGIYLKSNKIILTLDATKAESCRCLKVSSSYNTSL